MICAIVLAANWPVSAEVPPPTPSAPDHGALSGWNSSALLAGLSPEEYRDIEIFRRAAASTVYITSITYQRDLFSFDIAEIPQGTGSGFVWDDEGHIVTNYHVIEAGQKFAVTLSDQSEYQAEVVGVAADKDIAVLDIDAPAQKLQPLPIGASRSLLVGQRVLAVGNPFGFDHTLTVGVVSGLGRELTSPSGRRIRDVIQTDAAINPGNSGGPLLDSRGRLIGMNTAIFSPSGASAGIGFAVPVDTVARLVPQLIRRGRISQPGIGVAFLPDNWARRYGINGVVLRQIAAGSPAASAGLEAAAVDRRTGRIDLGDVIVAANGKAVREINDLLDVFDDVGIGGQVTLRVERNGRARNVQVNLVEMR
jgi:S1-C subfamily serine protease